MKIFYISQVGIPSTAAQSVGTMHLCEAFANLGYDTTLIVKNKLWERTPSGYNSNIWDFYGVEANFCVKKIPALPRSTLWFQRLALAHVDRSDGVVYTRSVTLTSMAVALHFRVVLEFHEVHADGEEKILEQCAKSPDLLGVVVLTAALGRYYTEKIPSLASKIIVSPNGAKEPKQTEIIDFQNSGRLQIGYIGHLYPGRGIDIIEALARKCSWAYFHLIGGTKADISYWKKRFGKLSNVKFYGFVPHSQTDVYRQSFDVLLAPYQKRVALGGGKGDTAKWLSPIKIFEYMAAGKPMLVSDLPMLRKLLKHEQTALLCEPENVASWISALEQLRDDSDLANRLGTSACEEFRAKYTWKARAERIVQGLDIETKLLK